MTTKRNTRIYSDFDLNFLPHPLTGDLQRKFDEESIKRAVKQLVLLNSYEKPFHPEIAGRVRELLFEPMGRGTAIGIESRIEFLIKQFEPRVELKEVIAEPDYEGNQYEITIIYTVLNLLSSVEQKIFLQRVR